LGVSAAGQAQQAGVSFFVTGDGVGQGADLGGLDGADRHCQQLAQAVAAGNRTWHAYLSTQAADGKPERQGSCRREGWRRAARRQQSDQADRPDLEGCSQADLRSTGGAGLFYCFAAN
jgi:hypothetical protein